MVSIYFYFSCLSNVSNKYYHGTGSDQLSAQQKGGMVSVAWENIVSDHGEAMGLNRESLGNYFDFSLFLLLLCLPNGSKKYDHGTGSN